VPTPCAGWANEIGDKTMYDAVKPFADALSDNVAQGMTLVPAWQAAAQTATTRARETSTLTPQLGRARPLAERSIGTPEAGATSMALIVTTVGKALARRQSQQAVTRAGVNG